MKTQFNIVSEMALTPVPKILPADFFSLSLKEVQVGRNIRPVLDKVAVPRIYFRIHICVKWRNAAYLPARPVTLFEKSSIFCY